MVKYGMVSCLGCAMIRLTLLLCGGLYLGLLVLGEDHGQKRYGLMLAEEPPAAAPSPQAVDDAVKDVVFIPARTVMEPTKVAAATAAAIPAAVPLVTEVAAVTALPAPLPEPEIPGGTLFSVVSRQVNVREGPGTTFPVVGSLSRGEQILVVLDDSPVEGWSRVRLEGDGVEGYIATRLLTPVN